MGLGLFWGKCLNDFFKEIYVFIVIFITWKCCGQRPRGRWPDYIYRAAI
jgi:hypothetical protein